MGWQTTNTEGEIYQQETVMEQLFLRQRSPGARVMADGPAAPRRAARLLLPAISQRRPLSPQSQPSQHNLHHFRPDCEGRCAARMPSRGRRDAHLTTARSRTPPAHCQHPLPFGGPQTKVYSRDPYSSTI